MDLFEDEAVDVSISDSGAEASKVTAEPDPAVSSVPPLTVPTPVNQSVM